jgi:collagen beta-1,O-galactosyltransferase
MTATFLVLTLLAIILNGDKDVEGTDFLQPSLNVVMLVHPYNKINFLPFTLGGLEQQAYPKERINVIFRIGVFGSKSMTPSSLYHWNQETLSMLHKWTDVHGRSYHKVVIQEDIEEMIDDDDSEYWSRRRFLKVIRMKDHSLKESIQDWAEFLLFMDSDVILTNENVFYELLVNKRNDSVAVFAPMLESLGTYSNFWAGITEKGYYKRTDEYLPILERTKTGMFTVPMVHSCVFIDLINRATHSLTFSPSETYGSSDNHPLDDIISFALSVKQRSLEMYVNNEQIWGFVPPNVDGIGNQFQAQEAIDLELESLVEGSPFPVGKGLKKFVRRPEKESLNFDNIYIINLLRRKERRDRMTKSLEILGLKAEFWAASDGKELTTETLDKMGISFLPEYLDPYHKRPTTMGEVGCFLSHYYIWKDMIDRNFSRVIILEDDVRFGRSFKSQVKTALRQLNLDDGSVDLIYLGRKKQSTKQEVFRSENFVEPEYSYWTIGYILTRSGAEKLIQADPLSKLLPVDEFLPIMYNQHPSKEWKQYFPVRNLKALSFNPLVLQPTHYVGDEKYISDTEDSKRISDSNDHPKLNDSPVLQAPDQRFIGKTSHSEL